MIRTKTLFIYSILSLMTFAPLSLQVSAAPHVPSTEKQAQVKALDELSKNSKGKEKVQWNKKKGVPNFISGKLSNKKLNNVTTATQIMEENKSLFHMKSSSELSLLSQNTDKLGFSMYKYQQVYQGVPVFGNEMIIHADKSDQATSINGYFDPEVKKKDLNTKPKLTLDQAFKEAKASLGVSNVKTFNIQKGSLYIYQAQNKTYHLVYLVTLSTLDGKKPVYANVFVDAHSGSIVHKIEKLAHTSATGTGTGVLGDKKSLNTDSYSGGYYLRDVKRGKIETYNMKNSSRESSLPGRLFSDSDNVWSDKAAVDAHAYAGKVYDYYLNKHGRKSFDGNGATLRSSVHFGNEYNNAFWNGVQMVYGDGDGTELDYLSGALDIVGHEITHAVTERTADLVYEYQSGALNESFSDVFGNLIENKNDSKWLIGEDVTTPDTPGDAGRSMSNPTLYDQPAHMDQYEDLPNTDEGDWGGVHVNSGIPNKAFFNFVTTSGITKDRAGQVWFRALTEYLTSHSEFIDARNATIQAATDLFGENSKEVKAVTNAWTRVGVE